MSGLEEDDVVLLVESNLPMSRLNATILDLQGDVPRCFASSEETGSRYISAKPSPRKLELAYFFQVFPEVECSTSYGILL
jgi:hypothetical protein